MGKLLDLAKSIAGEKSLLGRVGRWILAVSTKLDDSVPGPYIVTELFNAPQDIANLTPATVLVLDSIQVDGGISYNTATGRYVLPPGTYDLAFYAYWEVFNDQANDYARAIWVTGAGHQLPGASIIYPQASTRNQASLPVTRVIYSTLVEDTLHLESRGGSGAARLAAGAYAVVRKIG